MSLPDPSPARRERLRSLDAFRGATVAAMILVNNPGSWSDVFAPLRHAEWHGWTFTDLVFPFFLFVVGVAIPLALGAKRERGVPRGVLARRALRRALVLFALGLLLSGFPAFDLATLRIPGVLQRIAVTYLAGSLLFLCAPRRALPWVCAALLVGYWALMTFVPVPGFGAGQLDSKDGNLAAYVDRLLLEGHLWRSSRTWDPEGVLSTLPALATVLFGVLAGEGLRRAEPGDARTLRLLLFGALWALLGWVAAWGFPINKPLWTSSYALLMAGFASTALGLCHHAFDRGQRPGPVTARVGEALAVFGVNAILVFVGSGLLARTLTLVSWDAADGTSWTLKGFLYQHSFAPLLPPQLASLAWGLAWVAGWFLVLRLLWARGIVLKV